MRRPMLRTISSTSLRGRMEGGRGSGRMEGEEGEGIITVNNLVFRIPKSRPMLRTISSTRLWTREEGVVRGTREEGLVRREIAWD
jgi:hypothetical protein